MACGAFLPRRLSHLRKPFLIPLWYLYRVALRHFCTSQGQSLSCSLPFLKSLPVSFLPSPSYTTHTLIPLQSIMSFRKCMPMTNEMVQQGNMPALTTSAQSSRPTGKKERSDSHLLSSDLHMLPLAHACLHKLNKLKYKDQTLKTYGESHSVPVLLEQGQGGTWRWLFS